MNITFIYFNYHSSNEAETVTAPLEEKRIVTVRADCTSPTADAEAAECNSRFVGSVAKESPSLSVSIQLATKPVPKPSANNAAAYCSQVTVEDDIDWQRQASFFIGPGRLEHVTVANSDNFFVQ